MSTNNSNGNTIYVGGGGGSGNYVTWVPNTFTFTIPISSEPIEPPVVEKKINKDGCDCKKCKEFYPYAEPNQNDGTLICYACRHGY